MILYENKRCNAAAVTVTDRKSCQQPPKMRWRSMVMVENDDDDDITTMSLIHRRSGAASSNNSKRGTQRQKNDSCGCRCHAIIPSCWHMTSAALIFFLGMIFGMSIMSVYQNLDDYFHYYGQGIRVSAEPQQQRRRQGSDQDDSSSSRNNPPDACVTCFHRAAHQEFQPQQQSQSQPKKQHVTDKVDWHSYHTMYSSFLLPFYARKPQMKMLEIGLGCDSDYGPGASVKLWRLLFPNADLWQAETDRQCVETLHAKGQLKGFRVLVGDQGDPATLDRWIQESDGGHFDVVIDDGGHSNMQIRNTFDKLWPLLNRGGLYFIEDMQVGRRPGYEDSNGTSIMSQVLQDWMEQLVYEEPHHRMVRDTPLEPLVRHLVDPHPHPQQQEARPAEDASSASSPPCTHTATQQRRYHPKPPGLLFVMCQHEACVVGKEP